jgi:hypothetical protein
VILFFLTSVKSEFTLSLATQEPLFRLVSEILDGASPEGEALSLLYKTVLSFLGISDPTILLPEQFHTQNPSKYSNSPSKPSNSHSVQSRFPPSPIPQPASSTNCSARALPSPFVSRKSPTQFINFSPPPWKSRIKFAL